MDRLLRQRSGAIAATIIVLLVAVAALVAGGALGRSGPTGSLPSSRPPVSPPATLKPSAPAPSAPAPSVPADPRPSPPALPSDPPDDASDGVVQLHLLNWPGVSSAVVVWDESDTLADATSGRPDRDGPVAANVVEVAAIADDRIRLTWSDLPFDDRVQVSIRVGADGIYRIVVFRPGVEGPSDGVVSDRVLELAFNVAVPVSDVKATVVQRPGAAIGAGYIGTGLAGSDGTGLTLGVWDETDLLASARIEGIDRPAGDRDGTVRITNLESDTLRIAWSDEALPTDARLSIRLGADDRLHLRLVRARPPAPTGPRTLGREVVLVFHGVVDADAIVLDVVDGISNG
ncbi:MAG TPA: hypothetical protein VN773_01060 [Verrucomicrobiae bacterium]|nr:hypothetical protein [Verrucomicrobiae bacterium]